MNTAVKKINSYFKYANRSEIDMLLSQIILTERQKKVFDMFYINDRDIDFIADSLNVCRTVINTELKIIRTKIAKIMQTTS